MLWLNLSIKKSEIRRKCKTASQGITELSPPGWGFYHPICLSKVRFVKIYYDVTTWSGVARGVRGKGSRFTIDKFIKGDQVVPHKSRLQQLVNK